MIYFLTGNQKKVDEAKALLNVNIQPKNVDLIEIQSLNVEEASRAKAMEAKKFLPKGK